MPRERRNRRGEQPDDGLAMAFNDVLLNKIALMLLLVIASMAAIGVPDVTAAVVEEAKRESARAQEALEMAARERDAAVETVSQLEHERATLTGEIKELKPFKDKYAALSAGLRGVGMTVVFVVDASFSMGEVIAQLKDTIATIANTMPRLAPLRIGIVSYRATFAVFPITTIKPASEDGGASVKELERFLYGVSAQNSPADVAGALRLGMSMLTKADTGEGKQCLALLGDTGPYELTGPTEIVHSVEPQEVSAERDLVATVRSWAASRERRAVVAIFREPTELLESADAAARRKALASREFYRSVAAAAGGTYSDNPARLLSDLLEAMVVTND